MLHERSVDEEHIARLHRAHDIGPRVLGGHRLGALRGNDRALAAARDERGAVRVVAVCHPGACVDDSLAREGGLDHRGVGAGADRAEGDGLGPHPACRRENVEARADVESLVVNPLGAAAVHRGVARQHVVHEDLPHEDDSARSGIGGRGRGGCLGRSGFARILSLGGRGCARGRLVSRTQFQ